MWPLTGGKSLRIVVESDAEHLTVDVVILGESILWVEVVLHIDPSVKEKRKS